MRDWTCVLILTVKCLLRRHAGIHVFQRDSVKWKEEMEAAGRDGLITIVVTELLDR